MQSEAKFYGGSTEYELDGRDKVDFDPRFARVHTVNVSAATAVELSTAVPAGCFFFFHSIASSADVATISGSVNVAPGELWLFVFDGEAWLGYVRTPGLFSGATRAEARVFVVGGTGTSTTSDYYTPATNAWAAGPAPGSAKVEAAAAALGSKAYFVGTDPLGAASVKNDELDTVALVFTNRTDYPAQVMRASAALGENAGGAPAVFFYGGDGSDAVRSFVFNAFTTQASLPIRRSRGAAVSVARQDKLGRRVYVMNGGDPVGQPVLGHMTRADFYWSVTTQPGAARRSVAGFARAGRAHQVGGYLDSPTTRYSLNEEYDPAADVWTTRAATGAQRYGAAGASGLARGFLCGGRDAADAATATAASYVRDAWSSIASMPGARSEVRASGVSA